MAEVGVGIVAGASNRLKYSENVVSNIVVIDIAEAGIGEGVIVGEI
jgi:hypothetical protein